MEERIRRESTTISHTKTRNHQALGFIAPLPHPRPSEGVVQLLAPAWQPAALLAIGTGFRSLIHAPRIDPGPPRTIPVRGRRFLNSAPVSSPARRWPRQGPLPSGENARRSRSFSRGRGRRSQEDTGAGERPLAALSQTG